jgi:hypothetical protein
MWIETDMKLSTILLSLLTALTSPVLFAACHDDTENAGPQGTIALRINVEGHNINELHYTIKRPGRSDLTGVVDVSDPDADSFTLGAIPVGTGYTLRLDASSVPPAIVCAGESSPFDVTVGGTTPVTVVLSCRPIEDDTTTTETSSSTDTSSTTETSSSSSTDTSTETTETTETTTATQEGGVDVEIPINICPVITALIADPPSAAVGQDITLMVGVSDEDSDPLTYVWTSDGIALPTSPTVVYTCTFAGAHAIGVSVSDGYCATTDSLVVTCN